tara:strand:- start:840 stop:1106 length:267 start_codon:yes stop_codon:yes gene_type:complete
MNLYKLTRANFNNFFGTDLAVRFVSKQDITMVAQFPDCSSFLFITNKTYENLVELLDAVPSGYDFTYCQAWGLDFNQTVLDRVIEDLG